MFKELQIVKDKISNAHMDWIDVKVNGALNEEAMAEIEKIDWPSFPVFSLEDYCKDYSDLAVHYYIQHEMVFISAIVYGDADEKDDSDNEFMFDLYDLHELNGDDDCLIGILKAKSLEDAKRETEEWIKGGLHKEISIDRFDDIFSRYFDQGNKEGSGEHGELEMRKTKLAHGMIVHCRNLFEAYSLLKQLKDEGYRWNDGIRLLTEIRFSTDSAYMIHDKDNGRWVYSFPLDILHKHGYREIVEFADLEDKEVSDDTQDIVPVTVDFPTVKDVAILDQAVGRYGEDAQTDMMIEEMSELTKAILKYRRAKKKTNLDKGNAMLDVYEEMADVIIMLTQLLIMYGRKDLVQGEIDRKVKRLAGRLAKHKGE